MTSERIIDRIRKLLELSRSTNEHEAATAAARAAELMSDHEISEAMLQVSASADEVVPHIAERIVTEGMPESERTKQRVAWRDTILSALATSLELERYFTNGNLLAFGRETNVATWKYVGMYLVAEVQRLANEAWLKEGADLAAVGQRPGKWKGAFRIGAADVIANRLHADYYKRRDRERGLAKELAGAAGIDRGAAMTSAQHFALVRVDKALAIVEQDRKEVAAAYKQRSKDLNLRAAPRGGGSQRGRSGYAAGREAGAAVNIAGGGKALKS